MRGRFLGGIEIVHTSSELGMSGLLGGLATSVGDRFTLGATVGRLDIRDLVRTTTTPNAVGGSIPVFTQYGGMSGQYDWGPLRLATLARIHHERFDYLSETGFTLDFGATVSATPRLTISGATHFLPIDFSYQETTDYYFGLTYELMTEAALGDVPATIVGRYGATLRSGKRLEHAVGIGMLLARHLELDGLLTRELGDDTAAFRPGLAISLRFGRYLIGLARSSGLNDLGATYRVGLDAAILP